jgi:hypothetical protein
MTKTQGPCAVWSTLTNKLESVGPALEVGGALLSNCDNLRLYAQLHQLLIPLLCLHRVVAVC